MSYVGFGMELVLPIDAARDLAGTDGLDNGGDAGEEIVLLLLDLKTAVEA